jgi:membrane-anchored protein YejM (alkaline phosphatase superfamily)
VEYATPGTVALALEAALQSGDQTAMAELQGRRRPASLPTSPYITFVMLTNRTDRFFTYLYMDMRTYKPYEYHLEKVDGRYVVVPPDAYYYLYSGRWIRIFIPVAVGWWLLSLVGFLLVSVRRLSARLREQMYAG